MSLRDELNEIFDESFFPANKQEILEQVGDSSSELKHYVENLPDDEDFKYNSVDDILPQEKYVDYPFYRSACNNKFNIKFISPTEVLYVARYGNTICMYGENMYDHFLTYEESTKEDFELAAKEVMSFLKQYI